MLRMTTASTTLPRKNLGKCALDSPRSGAETSPAKMRSPTSTSASVYVHRGSVTRAGGAHVRRLLQRQAARGTSRCQQELCQTVVKEQWGKLTDDELAQINGDREQLEGKIQAKYGYAKDKAKQEVDDWCKRM